jgi:hypothetical protein
VFATGADSVAIFGQSRGSLGGGDVTISMKAAVRGGDGRGAGVRIDGGAANLVTNAVSLSAVSGVAIETTGGDDIVDNTGVVIGDISLGAGGQQLPQPRGRDIPRTRGHRPARLPARLGRRAKPAPARRLGRTCSR